MKVDLSIIIVSYKCREYLKKAIEAVFDSQGEFSFEVIVVDNASADGTNEMMQELFLGNPRYSQRLTFIPNTENLGFPKANNQGLLVSEGEYKLLLNPDTEVQPKALAFMLDWMKIHSNVGISTCKLIKPNGELDWACRRKFPNPAASFYKLSGLSKLFPKSQKFASYNLTYKSIDEETEIDSCVGAFMLISPDCYREVGLLDERFFMYGEDLDYCFRAKVLGYKVWYVPEVFTLHYKGVSSRKRPQKALHAFHSAMWRFYSKHYAMEYPRIFGYLVWLGIWSRFITLTILNYFRKEAYVSK